MRVKFHFRDGWGFRQIDGGIGRSVHRQRRSYAADFAGDVIAHDEANGILSRSHIGQRTFEADAASPQACHLVIRQRTREHLAKFFRDVVFLSLLGIGGDDVFEVDAVVGSSAQSDAARGELHHELRFLFVAVA